MTEEIKKTIEDFFKRADMAVTDVSVQSRGPGESLEINLTTDEAGYLIGERGANLRDFEFVLRLIIKKKFPGFSSVFLDINGYRKEREEIIRRQARQAAKEAVLKKESVMLEPMSAYERRLAHTELSTRPDVATESVGREPGRRVAVKPFP
jgi:spoIIIJ-associated protein